MSLHGDAWSDRVQEEKNVLDDKVRRLGEFLKTPVFDNLNKIQKALMKRQHTVMGTYSDILGDRLNAN